MLGQLENRVVQYDSVVQSLIPNKGWVCPLDSKELIKATRSWLVESGELGGIIVKICLGKKICLGCQEREHFERLDNE